jgi:hypothetical protein
VHAISSTRFQDANIAQIELIELLGRTPDRHDNVIVVSDDIQSIHRFRRARPLARDDHRHLTQLDFLAEAVNVVFPGPPSAWAGIFGDPVAVAAVVDRLVHHAEVIGLKGDRYRPRGKEGNDSPRATRPAESARTLTQFPKTSPTIADRPLCMGIQPIGLTQRRTLSLSR